MFEVLRDAAGLAVFVICAAVGLCIMGRYSIREGERLAPTYDAEEAAARAAEEQEE